MSGHEFFTFEKRLLGERTGDTMQIAGADSGRLDTPETATSNGVQCLSKKSPSGTSVKYPEQGNNVAQRTFLRSFCAFCGLYNKQQLSVFQQLMCTK